jgi:Matrixin
MQLVDGTPSLFNWCVCMSARSQLPDREDFQGWIAFNPRFKLSKDGMFLDSVHEIGHVFGLSHNADQSSIMSTFGRDERPAWLDAADLDELAGRHTLRPGIIGPGSRMNVIVRLPHRIAERTRRGLQR